MAALAAVLAGLVPACSALPFGRCEVVVSERQLATPDGRRGETLLVAGTKLDGVVLYEVRSPGEASRVAALAPDDLGGRVDRAWLAPDGNRPYVVSPAGRVLAVNPFTGRSSTIAELGALEAPAVATRGGALFVADGTRLFQVAVPAGLPVVVTGLPGRATGPVVPVSDGVAVLVHRGAGAAVAFVPTGSRSPARTAALPGEASAWTSLTSDPTGAGVVAGGPDRVARVDQGAASTSVTAPDGAVESVDAPGDHLVVVGDRLWSGGPAGRIDRFDPGTLTVASTTTVACDDEVPTPVAGAGSVWAAVDRDDVVGRLDPETGTLLARLSVPLPPRGEAARYRVVGGSATAWVVDEEGGGVYELDTDRNQARAVPLPGPPDAVADAVVVELPDP